MPKYIVLFDEQDFTTVDGGRSKRKFVTSFYARNDVAATRVSSNGQVFKEVLLGKGSAKKKIPKKKAPPTVMRAKKRRP